MSDSSSPLEPASGIEVSVVVPVYNPGSFIEPCIASLLAQTMATDRLELIFVDDASTDATPALLDQLAAEHPHVRVIHRETSSGWSGQPRNEGIEIARGRFIQFVDQDDALGAEALVRLTQLAERTGADVVIGKVISNGRRVSRHLFTRNRDRCSIRELPLEDSLTPHKLFRRSMLMEQGIRFPTTKRLEDQPFVLASYFAARNVSILADYPCYLFSKREDGANLSFSRLDPVVYYQNLRGIIDVVERGTEPGPLRNRILRRFFRAEIVRRLSEPVLLQLSEEDRAERFEHARAVAVERLGPMIAADLPPLTRMRAELILAGDLDNLVAFARQMSQITSWARSTSVRWQGTSLRMAIEAGLQLGDGTPIRFLRRGNDLHLDPRITDGLLDRDRTRIGAVADVEQILKVAVAIVGRGNPVEWALPDDLRVDLRPVPGGSDGEVEPVVAGTASLDLTLAAGGRALRDAVWDVVVQVRLGGLSHTRRLQMIGEDAGLPRPLMTGAPPRLATAYATRDLKNLSLDLGPTLTPLSRQLAARADGPLPIRRDRDRLDVRLPFEASSTMSHSAPGSAVLVLTRGEATVHLPARLVRDGDEVLVSGSFRDAVTPPPAGEWAVEVELDPGHPPGVAAGPITIPDGPLGRAKPLREQVVTRQVPGLAQLPAPVRRKLSRLPGQARKALRRARRG